MTDFNQILSVGMSALLSQPETRAAVVEYIKAVTNKEKPKEQWREVYWMQSDNVRKYPYEHAPNGFGYIECRLLVIAQFDERAKIANVEAFLTGTSDFRTNPFMPNNYEWFNKIDIDNRVFSCKEYTEAIRYTISWWPMVNQLWVDKTHE